MVWEMMVNTMAVNTMAVQMTGVAAKNGAGHTAGIITVIGWACGRQASKASIINILCCLCGWVGLRQWVSRAPIITGVVCRLLHAQQAKCKSKCDPISRISKFMHTCILDIHTSLTNDNYLTQDPRSRCTPWGMNDINHTRVVNTSDPGLWPPRIREWAHSLSFSFRHATYARPPGGQGILSRLWDQGKCTTSKMMWESLKRPQMLGCRGCSAW